MALGLLRLAPLALIGCLFVLFGSAAEEVDSRFATASAAFADGDYRVALTLFEAARAAGAEGPSVPYNIAVCHYKLGEYAVAEVEFAALGRRFPAMLPLAEYNRGLSLLRLERADDARAAFAAARADGDAKISALAAAQLRELGVAPSDARALPWNGYFEAGAGHDDNIALVEDLALPAGQSADSTFTELTGYASRWLPTRASIRIDASGYLVRYPDAAPFDQESLRVGAAFVRTRGMWRIDFGPHYYRSTLDGDGFQSELGAGVRLDRPLDRLGLGWRFAAGVTYSDVGALESRFAYLEGARRQMRVAIARRRDRSSFDASVDLEDSDRAAASVTASRSRFAVGFRRDVGATWSVGGAVSYRASRYDRARGPDEELTELRVNARRTLRRDWGLSADYRRSSNDADLPVFSYEANRIAVTIGRSF